MVRHVLAMAASAATAVPTDASVECCPQYYQKDLDISSMSVEASRLAEPLSPHRVAVDVIVRVKWGIRHVRLAKPPVAGLESSATRWWLPARKEKRKIRYTKGSQSQKRQLAMQRLHS
jgi:hypothetical protein